MSKHPVGHANGSRSFIATLALAMVVVATATGMSAVERTWEAPETAAVAVNPDEEIMKSALPDAAKAERKVMRRPSDRKTRIEAAKARLTEGADQQANVDAAQAHVLAVLAENPNDVESLLLAGQTSVLKNDFQAAARYYRAATLVAPDNASAFIGLGGALTRLGDEAGASAAFARYRALNGMAPLPRVENAK